MVVSLDSIKEAHQRIRNDIHQTPLMTCTALTARTRYPEVYLKCENLQKVGAFKIRGALNAVRKAKQQNPNLRGVVTHSSGNHAQAIALACRMCGLESHIVMPSNSPFAKKNATEGYGARVYLCEPTLKARETECNKVLARYPGTTVMIHPFDNDDVISGQGTIALELHQQLPLGVAAVVVPVGGGGLLSGVAAGLKSLRPDISVIGAEPEGADDAARSFRSGRVEAHTAGNPNTIADGLLTNLSPRTLGIIRGHVDDIVTVSDREIADAMRVVMERAKLVIEPSAGVGVAAAISGRIKLKRSGSIAVILCGGNVDLEALPTLLAKAKL